MIKKLAKKLKTPKQVQNYLNTFTYNEFDTLRSAAVVSRSKTTHCLEAAFLAAAILENHNYPPLVLSFESQDGIDHVVFVFKNKNNWGAVGFSRERGLRGRKPVFKSIRALALSYYEPYVDDTSQMTAYQLADLDKSKANWRTSKKNVWKTEKYLIKIPHKKIKPSRKKYLQLKQRYIEQGPLPLRKNWW